MAATQSSISTTRSSSGSSSARILNGIDEDHQQQQQLVRFNIEDFDSANRLPPSRSTLNSSISFEDSAIAGSSGGDDICNENTCDVIDRNRTTLVAAAASTVAASTKATTSTDQSQQSIPLSASNHHRHHSGNLDRIEPRQQGEFAAAARQQSTICHRCVREANSCLNNQHQEGLNSDQRRVRRLFAILRLWQPKTTEMQPVAPSGAIEADGVGSQQGFSDRQDNQHHNLPHHHNLHHHHYHHRPDVGAVAMSQATIPEQETIAASEAAAVAVVRPQEAPGRHSAVQQRSCSHYMMRNPIMFVPTCASNVPFATNIAPIRLAGPANELGGASEKKLWQSLVMPLVLGCIIFLIAVWTKQISLVLVNETIVMVIILGAVFVIMSGFAFWLAQDQVPPTTSGAVTSAITDSDNDHDGDDSGDAQYQHELSHRLQHQLRRHYARRSLTSTRDSQHNHEHELNYQHGPNGGALRTSRHHHHHSQSYSQSHHHGGSEHVSSRKCCGPIAIIDCQPPDYYSAMQNSFPVNLYPGQTDSTSNNESGNEKQTDLVRINIDNDEFLMCSPPTYDELINHNR